ncbi:MAG: phosphate-starvation-inducible PsiE family protein [Sulfolobales archaeon]
MLCQVPLSEIEKLRKFVSLVSRMAREYVELLEAVLVIILIALTLLAFGILVRDLFSLKLDSPLSELQVVVSDILVLVVLIELTRSFIISSLGGERYLEGFIEMGIIILVREVAVAAMTASMLNALLASLGVVLLVIALWISKEKFVVPSREKTGLTKGSE